IKTSIMKTIPELQKEIHANAIAKGWYEKVKSIPEHLALIHSEVSEALEADRKDKYCNPVSLAWFISTQDESHAIQEVFSDEIKNTFEDELADIIIRVMDLAEFKGIDLQSHIEA